MNNRLIEKSSELIDIFKEILKSDNVYYQPPASVRMKYPAIVFNRSDIDNTFANNNVYMQTHSYEVTVIDYDPDSEIVQKVSMLPTARFNRHFASDNLNHDVFIITY